MKTIMTSMLLCIAIMAGAQSNYTEEELRTKTDSIIKEGDLLFRFERAAWVSIDLAKEKKSVMDDYGGYHVYQSGDTIKTIILDEKKKNCVYELQYIGNFNKPAIEKTDKRGLTETEEKLITDRSKILSQIGSKEIPINCPEGFSLNLILIPFNKGYKLYLITGTSSSNVIPFGNDYLIYADEKAEITNWKKFHSRLLPMQTEYEGAKVLETTHSHLKAEPFISATDICTFRLYGPLYYQTGFEVYSPGISKRFKYNLTTNKVEIID